MNEFKGKMIIELAISAAGCLPEVQAFTSQPAFQLLHPGSAEDTLKAMPFKPVPKMIYILTYILYRHMCYIKLGPDNIYILYYVILHISCTPTMICIYSHVSYFVDDRKKSLRPQDGMAAWHNPPSRIFRFTT